MHTVCQQHVCIFFVFYGLWGRKTNSEGDLSEDSCLLHIVHTHCSLDIIKKCYYFNSPFDYLPLRSERQLNWNRGVFYFLTRIFFRRLVPMPVPRYLGQWDWVTDVGNPGAGSWWDEAISKCENTTPHHCSSHSLSLVLKLHAGDPLLQIGTHTPHG